MKCIKVGAVSLNQTPLDWHGNCQRILQAIEKGRAARVSILCLPELCLTGYYCEDLFLAPHVAQRAQQLLKEKIAPATKGMVVSVGLPISHQNSIFNAAALLVDTKIAGFVIKQHLAGDGVHYEPRVFKSWPAGVVSKIVIDDQSYKVGDIHFLIDDVRVGFEICEDAWVAKRPGANLSFQGVDIILNPSASHFARRKLGVRTRFVEEGSRAFGVTYIYANLVGNEAGSTIYDGGCLIAYDGTLIAAEDRFSYHDVNLTTAVIDVDYSRATRNGTASYKPLLDGIDDDCISIPFKFPEIEPMTYDSPKLLSWEFSEDLVFEEFCRAAALGLFDYLRKTRAQGFALSLSGGADSASIAALVSLMIRFAYDNLGLEGLKNKLSHIKQIKELQEDVDLIKKLTYILLSTLYQSTDNSSEITRQAAEQVAKSIGSHHAEINIQSIVNEYTHLIEKATNYKMNWESDDITLQNIQARTRAPSIWMLANLRNQILLATSNRSEASVGYATMDGDTAGGLSPIAGVDKPFIRAFLIWLEKKGVDISHHRKSDALISIDSGLVEIENYADKEIIKDKTLRFRIKELSFVNSQQPTAELRPKNEHQTDETDLMPYVVLNSIENLLVRKRLSPCEILKWLKVEYPQTDEKQLIIWLERYLKLFTRNQWKRARYAPGFHLDNYSLDPRSWFRFPIISSQFRDEIEQLKKEQNIESIK